MNILRVLYIGYTIILDGKNNRIIHSLYTLWLYNNVFQYSTLSYNLLKVKTVK